MLFALLLTLSLSAFAWLSVKHFRIALALFFALLPTYLIRFSIGPLPTTFLELCFWIVFGAWILKKIYGSRVKPGMTEAHLTTSNAAQNNNKQNSQIVMPDLIRHPSFSYTVLIIFIILSLTSLLIVPYEHLFASVGLWRAYLLEPFLCGWMLLDVLRDEQQKIRTFLSLTFSAFILATLGIVQYVTRLGIPAPWDIERRITSVFDYPNALGLFLAPLLSTLLVFGISTWKERRSNEKMFVVGAAVACFLTILLAKTEAALVAIPASLFIAFLISPHPLKKQKIASAVLATITLIAAFSFSPVREKLLLQDFSGQVRRSQWKEAFTLLTDHPLAGAGFGYYPELLRSYHHDWQYEIFQYPHNVVLNVWVELGILGVGGGVLGVVILIGKTWKRRNDPLVLAAATALLTMCIHGLVDVPFFKNDLAMMTVFFVIVVMCDPELCEGSSRIRG